jgi:hypothetical protein
MLQERKTKKTLKQCAEARMKVKIKTGRPRRRRRDEVAKCINTCIRRIKNREAMNINFWNSRKSVLQGKAQNGVQRLMMMMMMTMTIIIIITTTTIIIRNQNC